MLLLVLATTVGATKPGGGGLRGGAVVQLPEVDGSILVAPDGLCISFTVMFVFSNSDYSRLKHSKTTKLSNRKSKKTSKQ